MNIINCLILNFFLYLFLTIKIGRSGKWSLTYTLSAYYTFVATMSVFITSTGIYEAVLPINYNQPISFTPYILCFVSIALMLIPLQNVRFENINFEEIPYNKQSHVFINMWILITVAFMLMKLSHAIIASQIGYGNMYDIAAVDGTSTKLFYGGNTFLLKFNNFNTNLMHSFSPFVLCYALYGLIARRITQNRAFLIIGLVFLTKMFAALSLGSRGNLFFTFWSFVFYVIIFFPYLSGVAKNKIKKMSFAVIGVMTFYSVIISIARNATSDTETPLTGIARYFGECFPNLGIQFWDQVSFHPFGTRLFPYIFGSIYVEDSVQDGYAFWKSVTGVPVLIFKTIFGDLYIEFGSVLAMTFIIFLVVIYYLFIGRGKIGFWKMSLCYWYYEVVIQGVFGFDKSGWSNFIVFIAILLVTILMKIYTKKRI